jgi:S-(hydroxymethyl)glutathione dehydrogenase / alcohol dehydrogenase
VRAALLTEYGRPLLVEEVTPVPPGPGDVVVRMSASALCFTDCLNQRGTRGLARSLPTILGHAAVGVVARCGESVTHVRAGDRVVVPGTPECGRCHWCRRGRPDQCEHLALAPSVVATRSDGGEVRCLLGTYAEEIRVVGSWVFPLESSLDDVTLSLLGCGVTSGLGAVFNVAQVQPGASVAVVGCGHLGLWMVQGARLAGAERIIAVEPLSDRLELALALGATDAVNPAERDAVEAVRELTEGRGADYALEASGWPEAAEQAFLMAARAGTVVFTGVLSQKATVTFNQVELALRGRTLLSCQNGRCRMSRDIPRYVELLERGEVDAQPIITGRYGLAEINDALEAAASRRGLTGVIVP